MKATLSAVVLLGLLSSCSGGAGEASVDLTDAPNLVLISIDTMRPDYLGCYGYDRGVSPELDAFAAEGTIFEDVTSASPWTLPSHTTMLTGQYPSTHGVKSHEFSLTAESLATWLQKLGYQTIGIVNSHNIGDARYGLMQGFEIGEWVYEMELDEETGRMIPSVIYNRAPKIFGRAKKHLNKRDPEKPFFLFLHFYDVHTDFTPLPQYEAQYVDPYDGPLTSVTQDLSRARNRMLVGELELEDADVRYLEQMYDAEIRTFDQRLGGFFDFLEAKGLADSTVVCITSDHGEEYNEHGSLLHGRTHYQELVRIPWILRGPGVPPGRRVDTPVHLVDVAPTLYALAGIPGPPGMDGYDASLTWRAPESLPGLRYLFSEADHNNLVPGEDGKLTDAHDIKRMVRLENMVLHYDTVTEKKELYDISVDPFEQNDLAAEEPEQVAHLFEKLEEFHAREGSARVIGEVSEEDQALLDQLGYGGADQ